MSVFDRGRASRFGRIGDLVLVSGALLRFANRRGWVSDATAAKLGAPSSPGGRGVSVSEMALAVGAALRLLKAVRTRRS